MRDIEQITTASVVLSSGDILRSRYRILNQLGTGESSRTYLAEDLNRFNERCVLKEFAPQLKGTFVIEKAQELFEREAGVLYRLKHAQIAQFRQLFCHEREDLGCLFLVQDYVEGITYRDLLARRLSRSECFTEAEIRQLLTQVLPILEYIHSMGVIHRDISPDNLILRRRDQLPVLIDFGCIKEVEIKTQSELSIMHSPIIPSITTALGKAGYSPPEQLERGIVYAHSDLYALAATLVVLLTGEEPQQLINSQDNRWHWRSRFSLSPKLEWILNTMLSPHSSDRFGSAAEVIKTLQDIVITPATIPAESNNNQPEIADQRSEQRESAVLGVSPQRVAQIVVRRLGRKCVRSNFRKKAPSFAGRRICAIVPEGDWGSSASRNAPQSSLDDDLNEVLRGVISDSGNFQPRFTLPIYSIGNLLAKSLFFVPFTAVLFFAGYLCFRVVNLTEIAPLSITSAVNADTQLQNRFSWGERVLIEPTITPEKELAVAAFAKGNYYHAASLLAASLKALPNDPESLIYLNNARIGAAEAYSIAVSIPIGSDVNAAQEILRGVAQTQSQINQSGGINELPLKVQIINDDNDPKIAQQLARKLGQDREILGVVGHDASDVTLATAPVYEAAKLVAISPISTSVKLANFSPYIFRSVPSDRLAARGLARYMLEDRQQRKVAVFYNSTSNYSQSLKSEFTAAVGLEGGEVVNIFDLADANFNPGDRLNQAIDNGAETIMLAANTSTLDKALQVIQVNNKRLSLLGGDDVYTPKTLQIAGSSGEDLVLAIPWHIRNNPDDEFSQTAKQLWGEEVNWRSAMAYDASQALITAIAGNPNPTRVSVQKRLSEASFSATGASNKVKFLPSGDRSGNIQLVRMQASKNRFGYEFVPIKKK